MVQKQKSEIRIVKVSDIIEFPSELGSRCLLLQELGLSAYRNSEEEILEALVENAKRPESLDICLRYSRCRKFWEIFKKGETPFAERDPIRLLEYEGRFWVSEGKHRVCLAKRAGVKNLKAVVYRLKEDTESLLMPEGRPGHYCFSSSFGLNFRNPQGVRGTVAYLWVSSPPGMIAGAFDFRGAWLDVPQNTEGSFVELFPGFKYKVSVCRKSEKRGIFRRMDRLVVESEVLIEPDHSKTKIWLLEAPAKEIFSPKSSNPPLKTVYRFGCWRMYHMKQLTQMWLRLF
ncbi:MAG TPA: hypothetical protein PK728_01735 [Bacillota bacterium]|nr:hypothetical protein [Bacillota bacterium]